MILQVQFAGFNVFNIFITLMGSVSTWCYRIPHDCFYFIISTIIIIINNIILILILTLTLILIILIILILILIIIIIIITLIIINPAASSSQKNNSPTTMSPSTGSHFSPISPQPEEGGDIAHRHRRRCLRLTNKM